MLIRTALLLLLLCALAISCGPSLRRTHQSDNAFARCFDIDYNPGAKIRHKTKCWKTWLSEYVYNQPTDKIDYAEMRLEELEKGISIPGPPGPPGNFAGRPKPQEIPKTDPMPENPDLKPTPEETPETEEPEIDPAVQGCEQNCKADHTTCLESCGLDAGPETDCPPKCIEEYTICIKACLNRSEE